MIKKFVKQNIHVQYISDIHLEFLNVQQINKIKKSIEKNSDPNILILAGDIGNPYKEHYTDFLSTMNQRFNKVFLVAGNHEYYGNNVDATNDKIKSICDSLANTTFLNNSYEDYSGIRWIGTTLWTEIRDSMYTINDMNYIKDFNVERNNKLHGISRDFLEEIIKEGNSKNVIITHHLPIYNLTDKRFRRVPYSNYSDSFNANLDGFILKNNLKIKAWFYGHTHTPSVQKHYNVDFYCNPVGYKGENTVVDYCKMAVIESWGTN